MRRALVILALVGGLSAYVILTGGFDDAKQNAYEVELDNAFGLIQGGDLKVAGVRAGKITSIRLDKRTKHALVGFRIDKRGFGSLRRDVHCESRPQSLIGEYFLDCLPGTARQALKPGARIPVAQTSSTIAPDLVNDILREPQRERLRIIVSELGAGVAGRGPELNAAIRRASPALRETDRVLSSWASRTRRSRTSPSTRTPSSATSPPTARTSGASSTRRAPRRGPRPSAGRRSPRACRSSPASSNSSSRP